MAELSRDRRRGLLETGQAICSRRLLPGPAPCSTFSSSLHPGITSHPSLVVPWNTVCFCGFRPRPSSRASASRPRGGVENVSQQHPRSQSAGPFEPDTVPCTYPFGNPLSIVSRLPLFVSRSPPFTRQVSSVGSWFVPLARSRL